MARNLTLAMGRPLPSFGLRDAIAEVASTFALILAAGRVGAAVEARQTPSQADLKTAGLEDLTVFKGPDKF